MHASSRRGPGEVNAGSKCRATPDRAVRWHAMGCDGILIVEDDDAIASGLARVLDSQGYRVRRLGRGAPAPDAAREHDAALVILDLGLPDVDGLTVCRR